MLLLLGCVSSADFLPLHVFGVLILSGIAFLKFEICGQEVIGIVFLHMWNYLQIDPIIQDFSNVDIVHTSMVIFIPYDTIA